MITPTIASLDSMPIIAILRGLTPEDAVAVGEAVVEAGFICLEVPFNSPRSLESISRLRAALAGRAIVGAGTVLSANAVKDLADAGGQICISPNTDIEVIRAAKSHGLLSLPGAFTPSEVFQALSAGADAIKLFPAEVARPEGLRAIKVTLPSAVRIYAVGGVNPGSIDEWWKAGASGFGIGTSLFKPDQDIATTSAKARAFVTAMNQSRSGQAR